MKNYLFIFLATTILYSSCKKENFDPNENPSTSETVLLKRVIWDEDYTTEYQYYNDKRLKKAVHLSSLLDIIQEYEYQLDTMYYYYIESIDGQAYDTLVYKYYKVDNESSIIEYPEPISSDYSIYHFDNNPCGFVANEFYDQNGSITTSYTREYSDENCSYTIFKYNSVGALEQKTITTLDDKHSWQTSISYEFYRKGDYGNVNEVIYLSPNNDTLDHYHYNYLYNTNGYPDMRIRYIEGYLNDTTRFEYY